MTVTVPNGCHTTADGSGNYYNVHGKICDTVTTAQWREIIPVSIVLVTVTLALGMYILYGLYRRNRKYKDTTAALDGVSPDMVQSIFYPGSTGSKGGPGMNRLSSYSTMGSEKGLGKGSGGPIGSGSRRGSMASTVHGRSGLGFGTGNGNGVGGGREEIMARSGSVSSAGSGSASGSGHTPYPPPQVQHQQQPQIPTIQYNSNAYDRPSSAQSSAPTYMSNPNQAPAHEVQNPFGSDGGHADGLGGGSGFAVGQIVGHGHPGQGQGGYPLGDVYGGHSGR